MHRAIHILSLISLISLSFGSLTGCGEKRIHVSTLSGAPGDEIAALPPIDEAISSETSGLSEASVNESTLSGQNSAVEENLMESQTSDITNEPINMAHEPSVLPSQDGTPESALPDPIASAQESGLPGNDGLLDPLREGQDFKAQSSSSPSEDFQEPTRTQYSDPIPSPLTENPATELDNAFLGEDVEPVQDVFQIAKAEPSDGLQDQMNRLKKEELAAANAGLEDVFFQFDSWALTQEGKQSLQRTLAWFEQDSASNLIIEGHADQRGTQAYNMVLAKKRAVAVQEYLAQLGVDASRLAVITYGKDKPFCQDSTEVCHQLNRRGHLLIPNQ
ncbi:MAG: OmpA family protein [Ignavibacteria bacterium]|nr:OmpA family protein [Ignavibacteria bacterium]